MSKINEYSERQKTTFIELAQVVGIGKAIRELGYPKGWLTAKRWFDARGLEAPRSLTQQLAAAHRELYTTEEKLQAGRLLLDSINEKLNEDTLSAGELKQLADTFKKTVETMQLLEGKATLISQNNDAFDAQVQQLLDDMEQKNKEIQSKL